MKSAIVAIVAMASISASAATYVTVQDCTRGESGQQCETVRFKVRDGQAVQQNNGPQSDENQVQAPKTSGVPSWLRKLNKHYQDKGTGTPAFPGYEAP